MWDNEILKSVLHLRRCPYLPLNYEYEDAPFSLSAHILKTMRMSPSCVSYLRECSTHLWLVIKACLSKKKGRRMSKKLSVWDIKWWIKCCLVNTVVLRKRLKEERISQWAERVPESDCWWVNQCDEGRMFWSNDRKRLIRSYHNCVWKYYQET